MKKLLLSIILIVATGCVGGVRYEGPATLTYTPPTIKTEIEPSKVYNINKKTTWDSFVALLAGNIKSKDYKNGKMTVATANLPAYLTGMNTFDCGSYSKRNYNITLIGQSTANFVFKKVSKNKTKVTINSTATPLVIGYKYNPLTMQSEKMNNDSLPNGWMDTVVCISTGGLEKSLFDEVQGKVDYVKNINSKKWSKRFKKLVLEKKIAIGMTTEMARLSWGEPNDINRTVSTYGTREQWVYSGNYLYFKNGKLTSWQD